MAAVYLVLNQSIIQDTDAGVEISAPKCKLDNVAATTEVLL